MITKHKEWAQARAQYLTRLTCPKPLPKCMDAIIPLIIGPVMIRWFKSRKPFLETIHIQDKKLSA